ICVLCITTRTDIFTNPFMIQFLQPNTEAMVWRHTACTFNHSKIAVFGGSRRRTEKLNDLRILDIETKHWQLIDAPNAPSRRSDHSASMAQDRWLYVFGGSNVDVRPMNDLHCFD